MEHYLYTDGQSQYRNFGMGCFSYILINEQDDPLLSFAAIVEDTSEPRMKLRAIIEGVKASKKVTKELTIISSSDYALKVLSGEWSAHKHQDLISEYINVSADMKITYAWGNSGWVFKKVRKQCLDKLNKALKIKDKMLTNFVSYSMRNYDAIRESFEDYLLSIGFAERPAKDKKLKTFYKLGGDFFDQPNFQTFIRVGDLGIELDYYEKPHQKYSRTLKWREIRNKHLEDVFTFY